ncbi:MAG: heavy metal translocating P-type ATPase [Clostridia bacterium]|nr:heavy metal translocating P-type ATPase [Clostridia bacterium]
MKKDFIVTGMTCAACSARVEKAVKALDGVLKCDVNLLAGKMKVEMNESVTADAVVKAVTDAGYGAQEKGKEDSRKKENASDAREKEIKSMKIRTILSFVFMIPLMYVSMGSMVGLPLPAFLSGMEMSANFALIQLVLCLPVAYLNRAYYERGFKALIRRSPNMDSLIAVGSMASLIYGVFAMFRINYGLASGQMEIVHEYAHDLYFESAVMILALINLGKYMEAKSKGKTGEALERLMDLQPETAIREENDGVVEIAAADIQVGDILHVKPGTRIPADGVIVEGDASVDESAITGESMPVDKSVGDKVTGATVNLTRFFKMKVTHAGEETAFSKIIRMVEDASAAKAPIARLADKIAGVFVPVVMAISAVTFVLWMAYGAAFEFALSRAISVLVISCPCALGLATPVAIMVGMGKGAGSGILIKSGEALESAHNVNCVVMDKTGTLTLGKPVVTEVTAYGSGSDELVSLAAAVERASEHPLAQAVMEYAKAKGTQTLTAKDFEAIPGRGVKADVNGRTIFGGSVSWMKEIGKISPEVQKTADEMAQRGQTPMVFSDDNGILGIIGVSDKVKPTSAQAVQALNDIGVEVVMLTGDNEKTAHAVAEKIGVTKVLSGVLPGEKANEVASLKSKGRFVAMVGDGVNDAPALKTADVGIAIGAGTDVAIESADLVLMKSDPVDVANAIRLSKAVMKAIKQNLFWAFFYNVLGIPIAAGVLYPLFGITLSPMIAAGAMSISSLFVVTNALRLRKFMPIKAETSVCPMQSEAVQEDKRENIIEEEKQMITMKIEGMMCMHCHARVTKVLNAFEGVNAEVDLEKGQAKIEITGNVTIDALKQAVIDAGYEVTGIE